MAITRVEGPMLLANLDRQGTDLTFTTTGSSLLYMNFSQFRVGINTEVTSEDLTVNGNAAITTVKIDKFNTISTTQTDQDLKLIANGTGNILIVGANVTSGNVDNTQIGTVTPSKAVFTTANVLTKATLTLANVSNLKANRITFTASDNTQLTDDPGLNYFASNSTLVAQNFTTEQTATFPGITSDNVKIPTVSNNSVLYMAANNQVVGTPTLAYFAGNNLLATGNLKLTLPVQNRILWKDTTDHVVTSDRLTYDGTNLSSSYPNVNTFGNIRITADTIEQLPAGLATQPDLSILAAGGASGKVYFGGRLLYGLKTPSGGGISNDMASTVGYVNGLIQNASFSTVKIEQSISRVQVYHLGLEDELDHRPNVVIVANDVKNSEFSEGFANIQNISIHDSRMTSLLGELILTPDNNARLRVESNSSIGIPSGTTSQRPALAIAGDLRHNKDFNALEFNDGLTWQSVAPSTLSQTITPNGSSVAYTLSKAATPETILVHINGVIQHPYRAYTVLGNTITFVEAPLVTDIIEIRFLAFSITYASTPLFVNNPYKTFDTAYSAMDSFFLLNYRSAEYTFSFKNPGNNQYAMGTVYVMHDGIDTYLNVKEFSNGSTTYLTFNSYIDVYGAVWLQVKGVNSGNFIKYRVTYFSDDTAAYITWVSSGLLATYTDTTRVGISIQLEALSSTGSVITYNTTLAAGNLPSGLTLSSTGLISGTASAQVIDTVYNFSVTAQSPGLTNTTQDLSIQILAP